MSRLILITGASRGIGLELCRQYHDNGDRVIAVCRQSTDTLKELGVKIIENIDVTSAEDCHRLHDTLNDEYVDILINNAGLLHSETINDLDFENIQQQFEVNAMAPLRITGSLLNKLRSGSKVIMITSRMGSMDDNTSGGYYGYRMSKAALNMAGVSLANDLRPRKIAVGLIHPGFVSTRMTGYGGLIDPPESARNIINSIDKVTIENSGVFLHAEGQEL
ncbi:MAG: SDR family oxidoreductase, partial [Lentisphaeraceae bacterium]|nr:SDR family oxidoreductase [Lentisphaeraceae bacterium]